MKTPKFRRLIVAIAATTMLVSGCALKPRQQHSRFQCSSTAGGCGCYTCSYSDQSPQAAPQHFESVESVPQQFETVEATPTQATPTPVEETRKLYAVPEVPEPIVSTEPFQSHNLRAITEQEDPVINVVQPTDSDLNLDNLDSPSDLSNIGGGSFKPSAPEVVEISPVEAPNALETSMQKEKKVLEPLA